MTEEGGVKISATMVGRQQRIIKKKHWLKRPKEVALKNELCTKI